KAMTEVTGPIIAVALVLCAVFVPCAFISGITGRFFKQFAVTIAVSTVFSAINSLTLSPALAAILLGGKRRGPVGNGLRAIPPHDAVSPHDTGWSTPEGHGVNSLQDPERHGDQPVQSAWSLPSRPISFVLGLFARG